MTRRLHNWTYRDVTDFLLDHGFLFFKPLKGSHENWIKHGEKGEADKIVELNFTHKSYPINTLKMIIYDSGIPQEEWIRWGSA